MRPEDQEDFRKMLTETRETFKQSAAELLKEEIFEPAPTEAIALLRKTFNDVLDAVAESKKLWLELDLRATEEAKRLRERQMQMISARVRAGEDLNDEAEATNVALAELEAAQGIIKDGARAISERFGQRYRAADMLRVSQTCYTAVYDRDCFSELYAEMYSRYQAILFSPETSRLQRSQNRFVKEEDIRDSIVGHLDLGGSFSTIFKHAYLKAAHAFKFRALLEGDFLRKSYSVDDVAYILSVDCTRECPFCRASVSRSAKLCRTCNREFLDTDFIIAEMNSEISSRLEACKRNAQRLTDYLLKCGISEDSAKGVEEAWSGLKAAAEKRRPPPALGARPSPRAPDPPLDTPIQAPPVIQAPPKLAGKSAPPPIPPAVCAKSPGLTLDGPGGTKGLFLVRAVQDPALIARCRGLLDDWSSRIPFSPIKKLGSKTEFVSATEIATYKTAVTSQLEKRWLENHEAPYHGESLPATFHPGPEFDPWQMEFPRRADFSKHHHSIDLPDTRRVYDCSRCHAAGHVTCSSCSGRGEVQCRSCAGKGEVQCNSCSGYGFKECWNCGGRGHLRKTRTAQRHVSCSVCSGSGEYGNPATRCDRCAGRGTEIQDYDEEYYIPCGNCAASGKIPCSTCRASGKVTCSTCQGGGKLTCWTCSGSGQVTCPTCQGQRRLMGYVSAEQTEEPAEHEHQYIPQGLPSFSKKDNPLAKLDGTAVYSQDEKSAITVFGFDGEPAASILSAEVEACRQSHQGHVLRQRVNVERCSLVDYRYRHSGKTHAIFLNPTHGLLEDLGGPVQEAIENMDALAQKAFDEKRYEDAYRLNLRALCMDQANDAKKHLRNQILKRLTAAYRKTALLAWLICSLCWLMVGIFLPTQFNLPPVLTLVPLLAGVRLFSRDAALRFRDRSSRRLAAVLIGVASFFSGMAIDEHPSNLLPLFFVVIGLGVTAIARAGERGRRCRIERSVKAFPNIQALEAYVGGLDPTPDSDRKGVLALAASCLLVIAAVGISQVLAHLERRLLLAPLPKAEVTAKPREQEEAGIAPLLAAATAEDPGKATRDAAWKNSLGMVFVPVPGTKVLFSVWKTRVRDYAAYAEANPGVNMEWKNPGFQQRSAHPIVKVSWEDANAFCAWLTKKDQAAGLLGDHQQYRLPTDDEWSLAVGLTNEGNASPREKSLSATLVVFPWGDEWPPPRGVANLWSTNYDDFEYTSPVWAFKPNPLGLYDMGGNAKEWCEGFCDPEYRDFGRVLRGSDWSSTGTADKYSHYRSMDKPSNRDNSTSFRCVLALENKRP